MNRRTFLASVLVTSAGMALPRFGSSRTEPVVETAQGKIRGILNDQGIHVFKGMRYGRAKRFMPPVAPESWPVAR